MSGLDLLDADIGIMARNPAAVFGNIAINGDEYVRCNRCGYGGCDVRVQGCGCTLHAVGSSMAFCSKDSCDLRLIVGFSGDVLIFIQQIVEWGF